MKSSKWMACLISFLALRLVLISPLSACNSRVMLLHLNMLLGLQSFGQYGDAETELFFEGKQVDKEQL